MANNGYRKTGRREKKGRRGKRPWSDLPTELMELVLQNCNFSDQVRVRAVCRRWQSIPRVQPLTQQLPWLLGYDLRDWSRCKLFDFKEKKTYTVNISTMEEYYKEQNPVNICICASKSGWLLLSHIIMCQNPNTGFLLCSPFSNRIIKLPNMHIASYWVTAMFSADPTSADCVFFVLHKSIHTEAIEAFTCRRGDTTWTTHVFLGRIEEINNVVYSQGLFWCATDHGRLATFSVAKGIWNVLESPAPLRPILHVQEKTYFVQSNGNLLLLLLSAHTYNPVHVFKLDRSQMSWILVENTGDQTLFLGPTSFSVSTTVAAKLGLNGKIHYCWGTKCRYVSRNCKRIYAYGKRYVLLAKEKQLSKIWIEPPG